MSRRREAAELARVLALSTQQTKDIAEISPHSLSSGNAGATQDSRDMELKTMRPTHEVFTGASEDEVALFSSRSVEDEFNHSRIHSFDPSGVLHDSLQDTPSRRHEMPAPLPSVGRPPHHSIPETGKTPVPSSDHLSPTQLSAQAANELPIPAAYQDSVLNTRIPQQRTPLRPRASNQAFQVSSSPAEHFNVTKKPAQTPSKAIEVVSDPEEIEIIESIRPASMAKRAKMRPEIILQSKSASRSRSRHESPDPLDLIPSGSASTMPSTERRSEQPQSSATASTITGAERKSSRVKAAADKKELEKEEKRRLRRERKAQEQAELLAVDVPEKPSNSKRQRSNASTHTAGPKTYSNASMRSMRPTTASPALEHSTAAATVANVPQSIVEFPLRNETSPSVSLPPHVSPFKSPAKDVERGLRKDSEVRSPTPDAITQKEDPLAVEASAPKVFQKDPRQRELIASSSTARQSPGPTGPDGRPQRPDGIQWQTTRNDLSGVLAKFGGARPTGMSKRHRIAPLHAKIGPPAKALPPVPQKPVKRKKGDESDEEDSEEGGSEDENGVRKPKSKVKGMEWFMVED